MRRREFIAVVSAFALANGTARARAQSRRPVVGWLGSGLREPNEDNLRAFHKGLNEGGFFEGNNVDFDYRWAAGRPELMRQHAAELAARKVDVIVAAVSSQPALAARAATSTIPIIFLMGADPVQVGLVKSFNRPGGNATGITVIASEIALKRLEMFREIVPAARRLALFHNPANPSNVLNYQAADSPFRRAAEKLGLHMEPVAVADAAAIEPAFADAAALGADAVFVAPDSLFIDERRRIAELAAARRLPASAEMREFVSVGGLMSYGADLPEQHRLGGRYVARVLKGDNPAELPVALASKFELAVNLKTAKALGLNIPESFLVRADEVIE